MAKILFDIETREIPFSELMAMGLAPNLVAERPSEEAIMEKANGMNPNWKPETRLKKAEEWADNYSVKKEQEEWMKGAQLQPAFSIVAGVGYWTEDNPNDYVINLMTDKAYYQDRRDSEIALINDLLDLFRHYPTILGHYIRKFDLPYIMHRCLVLGIKFPMEIFKPEHIQERESNYVVYDTCEHLRKGSDFKSNLGHVGKMLGKGDKPIHAARLWSYPPDVRVEYLTYDIDVNLCLAKGLDLI
jgi:DNA polymerase elongation subunit (family B)